MKIKLLNKDGKRTKQFTQIQIRLLYRAKLIFLNRETGLYEWIDRADPEKPLDISVKGYMKPEQQQFRATAWKQTTCLGSRVYKAEARETVYGLAKRDFHGCDYVYVTPIRTVYRGINANIG
jgi:hypothetical protein